MSGHSKWATIKHKKGALDAKRGKIFTRLIKEIGIAAKNGGGDPDSNPRLRTAILAAKSENMPADNIKRAIQRGTGELPGATYEEFTLEGYGPGGVAILAEINTDNRNRTVSEIRHCFGKNNGNMAEAGAVSWMFHKKGDIVIPKSAAKEDDLMAIVLEAGGEDLRDDGDNWEILTEPSAYEAVLEAVKKAGITPSSSSVSMIPQNYIKLEGQAATQVDAQHRDTRLGHGAGGRQQRAVAAQDDHEIKIARGEIGARNDLRAVRVDGGLAVDDDLVVALAEPVKQRRQDLGEFRFRRLRDDGDGLGATGRRGPGWHGEGRIVIGVVATG